MRLGLISISVRTKKSVFRDIKEHNKLMRKVYPTDSYLAVGGYVDALANFGLITPDEYLALRQILSEEKL